MGKARTLEVSHKNCLHILRIKRQEALIAKESEFKIRAIFIKVFCLRCKQMFCFIRIVLLLEQIQSEWPSVGDPFPHGLATIANAPLGLSLNDAGSED